MSALAWIVIILVWLMVTAALAVFIQGCQRNWVEEEMENLCLEREANIARASEAPNDARTTLYIAGPMSGLPDFNYPAFHAAEDVLRAAGYQVSNPANNPAEDSWEGYMRAAITQLVQADGVALLPGWSNSRGASIEYTLASQIGMATKPIENWVNGASTLSAGSEVAQ